MISGLNPTIHVVKTHMKLTIQLHFLCILSRARVVGKSQEFVARTDCKLPLIIGLTDDMLPSTQLRLTVSDSPGLVDFAIGLLNSVFTCKPTGKRSSDHRRTIINPVDNKTFFRASRNDFQASAYYV